MVKQTESNVILQFNFRVKYMYKEPLLGFPIMRIWSNNCKSIKLIKVMFLIKCKFLDERF